ncbi:MAG: TlpA disulfide reductase family protein [Planctomycetaceae bacterium]
MSRSRFVLVPLILFTIAALAVSRGLAADKPPQASFMLGKFRPLQPGIEYERPEMTDVAKCRVQVDRKKGQSGWMVVGPSGQILRRFLDTNGDNLVDQWRYFRNGVEVYRDIDGNYNGKVDQARWLNTGGSRWGIDSNEDGRIDSWKRISAEEVSRVAVEALISRDVALLQTLLVTRNDMTALGIEAGLAKRMLAAVSDPATKLAQVPPLAAGTRWMRFDCSQPGLVPADDGKATVDIEVYESALAIVNTGKNSGLVQIGELVRVGSTWKLTGIPRPLAGDTVQVTAGGLLLQPVPSTITTAASGISPGMQKLLDQLRQLDNTPPGPTAPRNAIGQYHASRSDVLASLAKTASTPSERDQWTRQLIDNLAALVQSSTWPEALVRLNSEEKRLRQQSPRSALLPFTAYRHLLAHYSHSLQTATDQAGQSKAQQRWLADLGRFIDDYPRAEDTPEATWQLATAHEFASRTDQAKTWYTRLARQHGRTPAGQRAAGALVRLDLKGKPLLLTGKGLANTTIRSDSYRGKVLLVVYWATWCKPCTEELPALQLLYRQYRSRGLEILGVNLDLDRESVPTFVSAHRVTWPHLHEPGGLDSRLARQLGILSLPTMILVNQQGNVITTQATIADLKTEVPKLLGIKTADSP